MKSHSNSPAGRILVMSGCETSISLCKTVGYSEFFTFQANQNPDYITVLRLFCRADTRNEFVVIFY